MADAKNVVQPAAGIVAVPLAIDPVPPGPTITDVAGRASVGPRPPGAA